MNTLNVYTNTCLTCHEADRIHKIKQFAKDHGLKFTTKSTYIFPELKKEAAEKSTLPMPFIEHNGKSVSFYAVERSLMIPPTILDQLLQ